MSEREKLWHIALVCHSLRCGGAERAMVLLAQGLSDRGHQVSVITIDNDDSDFYTLSPQVKRIVLNVSSYSRDILQAVKSNLYRLLSLRKTIESLQPDIVISFMDITNVLTLLALVNTQSKVIVNEQNNPLALKSKPWQILRRLAYPLAAKLVSVSGGVDAGFEWLPKHKRTVIYNALTPIGDRPTTVELPQGADVEKKWVVAMGRLVKQKNFSMLLSAFHRIAQMHPDWQLLIFGEGELRSQLERQRDELGLQNRVLLPGITANPFGIYQRAQLYAMSSLWEGLPAVLFEALSCGLPIVSTDCPSGPREIIRDGIDGILVPTQDELALSQAMDLLMSDDSKRQALSDRAKEAQDRFSLVTIVAQWEELIQELI
ncbi:glycosyltransferase family 4 protein [Merismopedia glauca]|uniref:Glycosyltransferase family 4 protein n=1 Tax=Merismopedia glauca CCAP 1448/3 TaxID=1296344 RepID=A0A2T1C9A4_9CYAN|nr:glycosyltransferase family 4 protein [Merismopedia glauca]PSB04855.1 glycosyltransferase family 4 protein [Merismopedia glauca CCAP 1448/3]